MRFRGSSPGCPRIGAVAAVIAVGAAGCASGKATHLVYVHQANLGVDLSASAQGTARFVMGYDRETFALVPRVEPAQVDAQRPMPREATNQANTPEAMSLVSLASAHVSGLDHVRFGHLLASGRIAERIAASAAALAQLSQVKEQIEERVFGDQAGQGGGR